jgi:hypothetical protein
MKFEICRGFETIEFLVNGNLVLVADVAEIGGDGVEALTALFERTAIECGTVTQEIKE